MYRHGILNYLVSILLIVVIKIDFYFAFEQTVKGISLIQNYSMEMNALRRPLKVNLSTVKSEKIFLLENYNIVNDDVFLNITQLLKKYGFGAEQHKVVTKDEYILTLFRIPSKGPTVFLMHGLLSSADDWVTSGPTNSLAYLLSREGFDIWMGNARGNKHSRKHLKLSPDSPEFWNFSWDEIGRYDLPAMVDYVLRITEQTQLIYIGHSQGTTAFFVMCSELPEYNEKISLMVALSAVAWMSHIRSPIIRLMSPLSPFLYRQTRAIGLDEFLPSSTLMRTFQVLVCGLFDFAKLVCSNILFIICGYDSMEFDIINFPVFFSHTPAGASTKQLVHYAQGVVSGKFQKFDYGKEKNKHLYGSEGPPEYAVEKIKAPVAIFFGAGDWLSSLEDVETLRNKLFNVTDFYIVPHKKFNHLDFIIAKNIKHLIYEKLMDLLKRFTVFT